MSSADYYGAAFALGAMEAEGFSAVIGAIDDMSDRMAAEQQRTTEAVYVLNDTVIWGFSRMHDIGEEQTAELRGVNSRLDVVIQQNTEITGVLEHLSSMIENPNATKVAEHLRAASRSLSKGWYPEALVDCLRAIELTPTEGMAHFFAAVVYSHQDSEEQALARFLAAGKYLERGEIAERAFIQAASIYERLNDLTAALDCAKKALQCRRTLTSRFLVARYGMAADPNQQYEDALYQVMATDIAYVHVVAADPILRPREEALMRILERLRDERVSTQRRTLDAIEDSSTALYEAGNWVASQGIASAPAPLILPLDTAHQTLADNTIAATVVVADDIAKMKSAVQNTAKTLLATVRGWAESNTKELKDADERRADVERRSYERTGTAIGYLGVGASPFIIVGAAIAGGVFGYGIAYALLPRELAGCLAFFSAVIGAVVALVVAQRIVMWLVDKGATAGGALVSKALDKRASAYGQATSEQVRGIADVSHEASQRINAALAFLEA